MTNTIDHQPLTPHVHQAGDGAKYHFLNNLATVKARGQQLGMSAVEFLAPKDFGPPMHVHHDEDEIVVVLDGEVAFNCGDEETIGGAGAIAVLPHGIAHTFQVCSDTARMLSITATADGSPRFDQMVTALGEATDDDGLREPTDIDVGRVALVNADHNIDIVGPPPAPR